MLCLIINSCFIITKIVVRTAINQENKSERFYNFLMFQFVSKNIKPEK